MKLKKGGGSTSPEWWVNIKRNGGATCSGIYSHYHGTQEDLHGNQAVSELFSVLKIMDLLLDKMKSTKSKNKEILTTLVRHLFDYKIVTRIREENEGDLQVIFCDTCHCNHGLPDELRNLIVQIKQKLS